MPSAENMNLALIILVTGLVVVFVALTALIVVIKAYGSLVSSMTGKKQETKKETKPIPAPIPVPAVPAAPAAPTVQEGIPGEVVAAIAAAVDYLYGSGTHVVRSVRRVPQNRSSWGAAGLIENTRPF